MAEENQLAAPCGLYCGVCIDKLVYDECHGCFCDCGECAATSHHDRCEIFKCSVEQNELGGCHECEDFPCSMLIRFCYNPVWMHHLPVLENLRRRRTIGTKQWMKEQEKLWSHKWYRRMWLWLQKECEERLQRALKESKEFLVEEK
ncbi:MAG: hypothetical protein GWN31_07675 [Candidatus Thorarchaeota archaeon]|nr:hypothetical protein [Candidatus Thorarchaeota archaeon]NIW13796.1 hypothetical protein [Candidatus Thorarchaeota archaeon]NIW51924.1 hypothetical protein [Candidatus Korarchaeota archaeon]